jgi:hypothetical protein
MATKRMSNVGVIGKFAEALLLGESALQQALAELRNTYADSSANGILYRGGNLRNMNVKGGSPFRMQVQRFFHFVIAVGFFYLPSSFVSAEAVIHTCGLPNTYGAAIIPVKNQLGEFLIELKPPEYSDRNSVREHLVFSRLWSRILSLNLQARTHNACDAILDASFFPSLWAYLMVGTPRGVVSDQAKCLDALQSAIAQSEQDTSILKKAASDEASTIQSWSESPGNFIVEADNILKQSMRLIFDHGTVMEALASVGAAEFKEIDNDAFENWLRKQRADSKIFRIDFSKCTPTSEVLSNQKQNTDVSQLPSSTFKEPGVINVRAGSQGRRSLLYDVVVIGLKTPSYSLPGATAVVQADVLTRYCNHERSFSDDSVGLKTAVTVRCLRVVELMRPWVVLFCDPKDCSTKESAEMVANAIAKDPDILALVRASAENSQPIGPYLVNVE